MKMLIPALIVLFVISVVLVLRALKQRAAKQVRERLRCEAIILIDEMASCLGVESAGMAQVRGNGCLALTAKDVLFVM